MKRNWSRLLALILVAFIGLTGFASRDGLTGDYRQDTLDVLNNLKNVIELPKDAPDRIELQKEARQQIKTFAARYQRNNSVSNLASFTTMRTALNSLAGHYTTYPNRPVPEKLKKRLEQQFKRVEAALKRGS
ncbi:photosystem II protein Psb27 [Calothrix rhizosoleniae]|uniref:photosystem II protein Psb27 n=1 Tax=Calothrix rhizosoleniae TaxID=888997 RepID=UPI000B49ED91|nr:photosystem II protein Psb27 [Calothrix rhizosoleniae]